MQRYPRCCVRLVWVPREQNQFSYGVVNKVRLHALRMSLAALSGGAVRCRST